MRFPSNVESLFNGSLDDFVIRVDVYDYLAEVL